MLYHNGEKLTKEKFQNPGSEYRAAPFWAWNCKMTEAEIDNTLDALKAMGMGGGHIHCRTGMDNPYMGEEFLNLVKYSWKKSLEKDIVGLYEDNKFLKINVDKNKKDIRTLYKNMEHAFQKIGLIKYDAFQQMGGKLSFSLALLDENNNGFILNSVHSTEGCYTYTKEIKNGECAISLGEEEQQALDMAIGE